MLLCIEPEMELQDQTITLFLFFEKRIVLLFVLGDNYPASFVSEDDSVSSRSLRF